MNMKPVKGELVARASHEHAFLEMTLPPYSIPLFGTSNQIHSLCRVHQTRRKDGREAWLGNYDENDKLEAKMKAALHTRIWKGQSNFSLESFISQ
jgi:hypothetical protein